MDLTIEGARRIYVFDYPEPGALCEVWAHYYRECEILGADSVEVVLPDEAEVVISGTRYLAPGTSLDAVEREGCLQVICRSGQGAPVVMRKFREWERYAVIRRGTSSPGLDAHALAVDRR